MVQVPTFSSVTVLPDTVQIDGVSELKATASPEVAVAVTANGAVPKVLGPRAAKLIVCGATTEKVWVTEGAAPYVALPA